MGPWRAAALTSRRHCFCFGGSFTRYMNGTIEFRPQGTGLLYRVNMDHLFGVMEDHLAVW